MKKFLALILAFGLILCLCACGADKDNSDNDTKTQQSSQTETSSDDTATASFEVTVVDQNGDAVPGVMVQVCKDTCLPALTNSKGVATFNLEITDGCKLSVMSCPAGYDAQKVGEIHLDAGITEYTLEIKNKASE